MKYSWRKRNDAAIEGLPLYLLIIIIITAVSIGIVMTMLNMAKPPQTLGQVSLSTPVVVLNDPNKDGTYNNDSVSLVVTVTDSSGNKLSGAVITLTGNDIKTSACGNPYATTGSDGKASFSGLKCSVIGTGANPILITIEKSGYGKKTLDLPVVCE